MIEYKSSKLLYDLDMEKGIEIEEVKEIELKTPKTIANTIKKIIISGKYMYRILRHKKYCAY